MRLLMTCSDACGTCTPPVASGAASRTGRNAGLGLARPWSSSILQFRDTFLLLTAPSVSRLAGPCCCVSVISVGFPCNSIRFLSLFPLCSSPLAGCPLP